jgi:hypothetical protein
MVEFKYALELESLVYMCVGWDSTVFVCLYINLLGRRRASLYNTTVFLGHVELLLQT